MWIYIQCVYGETLPPLSTLKQSLIRLDTTGVETIAELVSTSLTKLNQRIKVRNDTFSKYVCSNGAFEFSCFALEEQILLRIPHRGVNIQYTCPEGLKAL